MKNIAKVGDILNLENGEQYSVVSASIINKKGYLGLVKVSADNDKLFDSQLVFVEEIVNLKGDYYLSPISDKKVISEIQASIKQRT